MPARERFSFRQETVIRPPLPGDEPGPHDPHGPQVPHTDGFRASTRTTSLGPVRMSVHTYSPLWDRAGRDSTVTRSDLVLCDPSHTCHGPDPAAHGTDPAAHGTVAAIHVQVPRALIPLRQDQVDRLAAVRMPAGEGIGALLGQFLTQVDRDASGYRPADAARLGSTLIDLLTALLVHHLDADAEPEPPASGRRSPAGGRRELLARIHDHIERSLSDRELCPAAIAVACHVSLRTLHRLFREEDTTVRDWIRARRLERCRRELADPRCRHQPVHVIAARWGHPDPANFTRAFRTAYGVTPHSYRRQCLDDSQQS
ncbi:AraC family transcriptional regulator [Streptomyces sp. NPDC002328]|uniref:AraC family transcriptional regulator n=1 Tax=Streptomyces sp. NPDC002328 TaxID=3364642 RepID=UPI0036C24E65